MREVDEAVELRSEGDEAAVSIPGASGHHEPGTRAELVDKVLDDPRVQQSERVTMALPKGDSEALLEAQKRLRKAQTRPAGASVIIDAPVEDEEGEQPTDEQA